MRCCHPYIAALYAAYKDNRHIYLLMELAPHGNLYQMLMAMPVPQVRVQEAGLFYNRQGYHLLRSGLGTHNHTCLYPVSAVCCT